MAKHPIPIYANIKTEGDNSRCQKTKNAAIHSKINLELKFQYAKKQRLSEQLYKIHLEYASPEKYNII
jgi:hypothetical protein